MVGLGKYRMGGYGQIGVYRIKGPPSQMLYIGHGIFIILNYQT